MGTTTRSVRAAERRASRSRRAINVIDALERERDAARAEVGELRARLAAHNYSDAHETTVAEAAAAAAEADAAVAEAAETVVAEAAEAVAVVEAAAASDAADAAKAARAAHAVIANVCAERDAALARLAAATTDARHTKQLVRATSDRLMAALVDCDALSVTLGAARAAAIDTPGPYVRTPLFDGDMYARIMATAPPPPPPSASRGADAFQMACMHTAYRDAHLQWLNADHARLFSLCAMLELGGMHTERLFQRLRAAALNQPPPRDAAQPPHNTAQPPHDTAQPPHNTAPTPRVQFLPPVLPPEPMMPPVLPSLQRA
jgi:hypothetical protein